jgi:hypothetical protein
MIFYCKKCISCGGLIMLAVYFCHSYKTQVEYNYSLIKVDWLAAWIALREIY